MTNEEMANNFRIKRDQEINEYNENVENEYSTKSELEEKCEKEIINYLRTHKKFAKKVAEMFTPKKEKEETKRNKKYSKFFPYILVGSMLVSGILGEKIGEKQKDVYDYPTTYTSIESAPTELQQAYIEDAYSNSFIEAKENEEKRKENGENVDWNYSGNKSYENYETALHSNTATKEELNEMAKNISNGTGSDDFESTLPFEYTDYSKAVVQDGEVYMPAKGEIDDTDEIISRGGNLYKKGR